MIAPEEVRTRAAALLEPISAAVPAGEAATFDPRYERLRAELAKLDSPTGGDVDWKMVESSGSELLTQASKDLLVASYTAYALFEMHGLAGLATGIAMVSGLVDRYWDNMFPPVKRMRGRGNALSWLIERLEHTLDGVKVDPSERAAFELLSETMKGLAAQSRDKFGDHAPAMGRVLESLERVRLSFPAPAEPEAPAAVAADAQTDGAAAPQPTQPPAVQQPAAATPTGEASAPAPAAVPAPPAQPTPEDAIRQRVAPWLEPVSADQPAGSDARFESEYEELRGEMAKLDAISGPEVDWAVAVRNGDAILKRKSKDLLIACFYAYGRFQQQGIDGLIVGLTIVTELIDRYWDTYFPPLKRIRGRANALGWLVDRLDDGLLQVKLKPTDRAAVLMLEKVTQRWATVVRDRFQDNAPGLRPVTEAIKRMVVNVPAEKPPEAPKPAAPTPVAAAQPTAARPAAPMPQAPTGAVAGAADATKFLVDVGKSMVQVAGVLRRENDSNPDAYRLMRTGLWLHMRAPPPADAGGKTQLPPLDQNRRSQFTLMASNAKWKELIEEAESTLIRSRFSLDLNRYTAYALQRAGDQYAAAREAVITQVAALLERMPSLPDLLASDGSPLCDPDTKAWLASEVAGSGGVAIETGGAATEDSGAAEFADKIGKLMKDGKQPDAMRLAKELIDETANPRQRFQRRLVLARLCLDGGQAQLARGLYAALERELRERGLTEWEPSLAVQCLEGFVRAIRAAAQAGSPYDHADLAFERLCLLDPAAAARLSS